ncbi:MAG: structural toxin protein RtxA, partial [Rhodocyclales bacterium]|nr:structural toxin protein RtxA [Rhodocyclales bacterium]
GDSDTAAVSLGQDVFSIQDDGPNAELAAESVLPTAMVDESPVPDAGDGVTEATITGAAVQALFAAPDFGTDDEGSVSYALFLDGEDVGSGLYALDATDTSAGDGDGIGQGDEILLNQSGNTITGSAGSTDYFT